MPRTDRRPAHRLRPAAVMAALVTVSGGPILAVTPGVDIAAPRVAISTVNGTVLQFSPARIVVEQFDYVRWNWTGGSHTTTSGTSCLADGLWSSALSSITTTFTRFFDDDPFTYPYYCAPHCGFGMTGQVIVTPEIPLTVAANGAAIQLDWSGASGQYRVFRSTSPLFTSGTTTTLTPTGTTSSSLLDQTVGTPALGTATYYLVMNFF